MARCDAIRNCADDTVGLFQQLNSTSDEKTRIAISKQITNSIVNCLNANGFKCSAYSHDGIDFGWINGCHVRYDVVENAKGTKGMTARLACIHNLEGNCGNEITGSGNGGSGSGNDIITGNDITVTTMQNWWVDYGPYLLIGVLAYFIFIRK